MRCCTTLAAELGRRHIFLIGTTRNDPYGIIWRRSLQRLGFIPRRAHPDVTFFGRHQDHRHGLGMDRFNDRVRRGGQEAIDKMRTWDRLRLGATITFEFGPYPGEGERRAITIEREPDDILLFGLEVRLRRVLRSWPGPGNGFPALASRASEVTKCS
jgi:hypothetical protein